MSAIRLRFTLFNSDNYGFYEVALFSDPNVLASNISIPETGDWQDVSAYFGGPVGSVLIRSVEEATTVPLPAALPLFAGGLGLMGLLARRKKRKAAAEA